ncbi:MAG: type II secretion system F family protein [Deltaproteobacteria bacterium]|nr:type II secretion system F family protein [Deltaproteobacteria bacterium]
MRQLLTVLVAVAIVALLQGLFYTFRFLGEKKREELRRRLRAEEGVESAQLSLLRRGHLARSAWLASLLRNLPTAERLEMLIQQAQVPITVAQLLTYSTMLAFLGVLLGVLARGWAVAVLGGLMGLGTPLFIILIKRDQRSRKLSEQLPDALDMMARSLRAGHALPSTFRLVSTEMPDPVATEFGLAFEEQNLGASFERAVLQMAKRAPDNGDLKIFAVSVVIQKETGGNLVEVIEKIAETIRARYRFYGKLRALTAEGRLSGIVLAALPVVTGLLVAVLNPGYMRLLVATRLGQFFLVYAIATWILGVLWLRRMARVDL